MNRHTYSLLISLLLVLTPVHGHEHHSHTELPEEVPTVSIDSILWIHIFLQATVWGILFPIGMVFGLSRSRWHVPLQVSYASAPLVSLQLTDGLVRFFFFCFCYQDYRHRACAWWLHPWACTWRPEFPFECTWNICQHPPIVDCCAGHTRRVPQVAHSRADVAALGHACSRNCRKVISSARLGTAALWRDRVPRILWPWLRDAGMYGAL
jgi:Domain of unknown function (DUF2427)